MSSNYVDRAPEEKQEPEFGKIVYDMKTGRALVEMSQQALQKAQQALPFYDNAMVGLQNELDRISQQERNVRAHPIAGMLSRLAGNLAMQPDMPGFVRGLGMTAAQENPDPDRLAMQKMPIWKELAEMSNRQALTNVQVAQTGLSGATAMENAKTNRAYRESTADAKQQGADRMVVDEVRKNIEGGVTNPSIYKSLKPNASQEELDSYIQQATYFQKRKEAELGALAEQRLSTAQERGARAGYLHTQDILKKQFAPLDALKIEAEIDRMYSRVAVDQFDMAEKKAQLLNAYENTQRLKGQAKVNALIQLGGLPNLEGSTFRQEILKQIEKAGGDPKDAQRSWAAVQEAVGTGGTPSSATPAPVREAATTAIGGINARRDRIGGINPRAGRDVSVPTARPGQPQAPADAMAPAYPLAQAQLDAQNTPPAAAAQLQIGETRVFFNPAAKRWAKWRMTGGGPVLEDSGFGDPPRK